MVERKPLSKKVRFEVFKRDSFTCQYCGSKAPDVILEIDHINPVSKGGKNDILNLITTCFECNRGKSNKTINDLSTIEKQRKQIEELNIRRQQLEMILQWRDAISDLKSIEYNKAISSFNNYFSKYKLNESGEKTIKSYIKKFGIRQTLNAIDLSIEKYKNSDEDFELCLKKVGGILVYENMPDDKKMIAYIKGICRNKFNYVPEPKISIALSEYYKKGYDLNKLKKKLVDGEFRNISQMLIWMED